MIFFLGLLPFILRNCLIMYSPAESSPFIGFPIPKSSHGTPTRNCLKATRQGGRRRLASSGTPFCKDRAPDFGIVHAHIRLCGTFQILLVKQSLYIQVKPTTIDKYIQGCGENLSHEDFLKKNLIPCKSDARDHRAKDEEFLLDLGLTLSRT